MDNKQDKGFTLVELLIVIVILGILATVTVFAVRGITDKGKTNSCAVEKKTIETAVEAFYAQTGSAPTSFDDLAGDQYLKGDAGTLEGNWEMVETPATETTPSITNVYAIAADEDVAGSGKCAGQGFDAP